MRLSRLEWKVKIENRIVTRIGNDEGDDENVAGKHEMYITTIVARFSNDISSWLCHRLCQSISLTCKWSRRPFITDLRINFSNLLAVDNNWLAISLFKCVSVSWEVWRNCFVYRVNETLLSPAAKPPFYTLMSQLGYAFCLRTRFNHRTLPPSAGSRVKWNQRIVENKSNFDVSS